VAAQTIREQLAASALAMNEGQGDARRALQLLAEHRYLHHGVPREMGGEGDTLWEAVQAIAEVSAECLTTAFLFWCQRVFIEYLLHTPNIDLRDTLLPEILDARRAGATGLSNAMKYLGGLEPLRTRAVLHEEEIQLDGHLPWASNLQVSRFVVAVAAQVDEHQAIVAAVPAEAQGVERSETFQLLGLQSSETASLTLRSVRLPYRWLLSDDAPAFLQQGSSGLSAVTVRAADGDSAAGIAGSIDENAGCEGDSGTAGGDRLPTVAPATTAHTTACPAKTIRTV
jgi:alkylation response protein AidB-like acyl-CoA dehydrogenase